jgi:hypothetical protein
MKGGRIRHTKGFEGIRGLDDRAFVEVKIEAGAKSEGQGAEDAFGDDEPSAAGLVDRGNGFREGVRVEGLAVTHGAEIDEGEGAAGDDGEGGFDVFCGGDIDGGPTKVCKDDGGG